MPKQIPKNAAVGARNPFFHGREGRFNARLPKSALHLARTKELGRHFQIVFAP
jgi:hypothetical protein